MPMTVGELSRQAGVHLETVRFYETAGLLPEPVRSRAGRRLYREADIHRIRFIQHAKNVGFTLKEIAQLMHLREAPDATCADVFELATAKVAEIDAKIALLQGMRDHLQTLIQGCSNNASSADHCRILQGLDDESCCADSRGKKKGLAR